MKHLVTHKSILEATRAYAQAADDGAELLAGGTDVVDRMRQGISSPEPLIRILRHLPDTIEAEDGFIRIGAGARLCDVATHQTVRAVPALEEALLHTATPQIRAGATIGGAIRQRVRCHYFRHPDLQCLRRGGNSCLARGGHHESHAVFDTEAGCVAVHPSTLLTAMLALGGSLTCLVDKETKTFLVDDLVGVDLRDPHSDLALPAHAVITRIEVRNTPSRQGYLRASPRELADWAAVEVAASLREDAGRVVGARIALGAVARAPRRATAAEAALIGKPLTASSIVEAAARAADGAQPLPGTRYKVQLVEGAVRALLERIA